MNIPKEDIYTALCDMHYLKGLIMGLVKEDIELSLECNKRFNHTMALLSGLLADKARIEPQERSDKE